MKKNIKTIFLLTLLVLLLAGITSVNATDDISNDTICDTSTQIEATPTSEVQNNVISDNKEIKKTTTNIVKEDGNNIDYYVSDIDGQDTNTGTQESPFKTIQTAIDKTTADKTYNIYIAEGTYKGLGNTNLTVNGNYNINFIGSHLNNTIIDGEAKYDIDTEEYHWDSSDIWSFYVNSSGNYFMTINQGAGQIQLTNFTIYNMYSPGGASIDAYRHATVDNYANLEVNNMNFIQNHAGVGSAVRNNNGATLLVNNSYFENNRKSSSTGNDGIIYNNGTATILNSLFDHNYARWSTILNDNNLTVINTTLSNNIGYDGKSEYKYGAGIGFNTGYADFYAPGYFLTYNKIINCTFFNNDQTDICGYAGNMELSGCKFINSTGIYIRDPTVEKNHNIIIDNNSFENMIPSSIDATLSSGDIQFSINSEVEDANIIISNNNIISKNGTINVNKATIINNTIDCLGEGKSIKTGNFSTIENNVLYSPVEVQNNNTIRYNDIQTNVGYTTIVSGSNNVVTNNYLRSLSGNGDDTVIVSHTGSENIVKDNEDLPIYCSPDVTTPGEGTRNNPTTIEDALSKVVDNATIYLLKGTTGRYSITQTISISSSTIPNGVTKFTIRGDNVVLDGQDTTQILNINSPVELTIENITFQNGNSMMGAALQALSVKTIDMNNVNFISNKGQYGTVLIANPEGYFNLQGKNNFINNTGSALYLNTKNNNITGENLFKDNTASQSGGGALILYSETTITGNNTFINNYASANGGAIYFQVTKGKLNMENANFINNSAKTMGGAVYFTGAIITVNGTNNYINNNASTGGALYINTASTGSIINGTNNFINNSATGNGGSIFKTGMPLNLNGNNTFINSKAKTGGSISGNTLSITGNTVFINSTATTLGGSIQGGQMTIDACVFNNSNASNGAAIYSTAGAEVTNSKFINCMGGETIYSEFERIKENNSYENCSFLRNFEILLDNNTVVPVQLNDMVNIQITETLKNPEYYDEDICEKTNITYAPVSYEVYANKQLVNTTDAGITSFYVLADKVADFEVYAKSSTGSISNTLFLDVEQDHLKNVYIVSPTSYIDVNKTGNVTVEIFDKTGNPIENVGTVYVYDTDNILLGSASPINGVANIEVGPYDSFTQFDIIIEYHADATYNNQTNTSKIVTAMHDVYANLDLTEADIGTKDKPTTLTDAITKIANGGTIHLLHETDEYIQTQLLYLSTGTSRPGVTGYNITAEDTPITFTSDGQNSIFQIMGGTIQLNNMNFKNLKNSAIIVSATLVINGTCIFDNNTAQMGAAIKSQERNSLIIIKGSNQFTNNHATQGGKGGGAIYTEGNLTILGENSFINNTVSIGSNNAYGGAITITRKDQMPRPPVPTLRIEGKNIFDSNSVSALSNANGGAIYAISNTFITGENVFTNNNAEDQATGGYGGALYSNSGNLTAAYTEAKIIGNTFENSGCDQKGGFIYSSYGNLIIQNNTFINATSTTGGAIYNLNDDINNINITISNNTFINITAEQGGAIYSTKSGILIISNNTFTNIQANNETINLENEEERIITDNIYYNCSIGIENINITSPQESSTITETTPINIIIGGQLAYPEYYDEDILEKFTYNLYVNDENTYNMTNGTATIYGKYTKDNQGILNIYATKDELQSNIIQVFLEKPEAVLELSSPTENTVNKTTPITIIVMDQEGNLVKDAQIKVTSNSVDETVTLANGVLVYQYTPQSVGEEIITFTFSGNEMLNQTEKTLTLTVTPDKDKIIEELNNTVQDLNNTIEEQTGTINTLNDTVNNLNNTVQEQANTIDTLNNTIEEQAGTISDLNNTIQEQTGTITTLNDTVNNLNNTVQEQANTIDTLNNTIEEQTGTITDLNNTIQEQTSTITTLNDTVNDLNSTVQEQAGTINDLNNTVQQQNATITDLQEQIEELKAPKNTTITFDEITARYNEEVTISGTLVNEDSIGLFNQVVTLTIGETEVNVTTKGGVFEYTTTFKELGEKTVTASYAGNDKYQASDATTTFNVEKQDIIITYDTIQDTQYKDNVTITGKVTDVNGKALYNINAIITINGKLYKAKTDKTGAFTFTLAASTVGLNNVTISYKGNTNYNGYETSTTFNVDKQDIIITYDAIVDAKYKEDVTITGKITDINGKALYNINALITINGKLYKAKTDNTGAFTLTLAATTVGSNNISISYGGNNYYNSYETSTTFNVEKQDITITYDPLVDTVCGENVTITGKVVDVTGKAVYNINANIRINGKLYKAKTDSSGAFTLSVATTTVGTNNVTISYAGNTNYNSYETTTTFNVLEKTE